MGKSQNRLYVFRDGRVIEITLDESGTVVSERPIIGDVRIDLATGEIAIDYYNRKARMAWLKHTARIVR